jgi:hypothetical protein
MVGIQMTSWPGIWVDLLYAADDVRTWREWEREFVTSGAIEDFPSEEF